MAEIILVGIVTIWHLWCLLYISGYKTNTLIKWGPYLVYPNPLYFCSCLGGTGVGLASETLTLPGIVLIGFALYYPLLIRADGREVLNNDFDDYFDSTPRFFTSYRPLKEPQEYAFKLIAFRKGLFDGLWFIWLAGVLELVEAFHEYGIFPVLLRLCSARPIWKISRPFSVRSLPFPSCA